jgi:Domain of unknown function (DUF4145)
MAELVTNCPRCRIDRITFDVMALHLVRFSHGWHHTFEAFAICRHCQRSTVFVLEENTNHDTHMFASMSPMQVEGVALNEYFNVRGHISLKDQGAIPPPEHLPEQIANVFREGATCLAVDCHNAAGTMFRMCLDLATRPMLPQEDVPGLNKRTRRDLGLRLPWLFDNGKLPSDLRDLSTCVREDGNDGAHQGTLTEEDAEDLLDFTVAMLERLFTEPERLKMARERREKRRATSDAPRNG